MTMINTQVEFASKKKAFLNTAESIGKQLVRDAIWSAEGFCNWQGASLETIKGTHQLTQRTFKADIYNGLAGIALFLSELYANTSKPIYFHTLEGTIKNILHQHETTPLPSNFSFFGGKLGTGYTLWRIGSALKQPKWRQKGLEILKTIEKEDLQNSELDVIGGAAGAIPVLLGIYQQEKYNSLLNAAIKCGEFLLAKAEKTPYYWYWKFYNLNTGLTGYSHGAAGIAGALLELFLATGDSKYQEGAMKGFAFERAHYNPQVQNWPDLRNYDPNSGKSPNYGQVWCHGAPGIALARLKAYYQTKDPAFFEEVTAALNTTYQNVTETMKNPGWANFSLCHGIAGNAEVLLVAGKMLQNPAYIQVAEQVGHLGSQLYEQTGTDWPSGLHDPSGRTQGRNCTPGLMQGMAGTGYFYLRLANPEIPTLLLL